MTENMHPEHPAPKTGGRTKWIVGAVAVIAVIGIGAAVSGSNVEDDAPVAISEYVPAPHPSEQAPLVAPAPEQVEQHRAAEAKTITRDGMFKVGTDIAPGTYAYTLRNPLAYYELCTDAMCTIEVDGTGSMLANDMPQGDGYLTIGPEVVYAKLQGLDLTPAE